MAPALKSSLYATSFFLLTVLSFGTNDWFSFFMLISSVFFLYPTVLVGQMTLRNVAKTAVDKESVIYAFLNKPKTFPQQVFSGFVALVLGVSFLTIAKGIELNHGLIPVLLIIFILTWLVSGRLVTNPGLSDLEARHLRKEATTASAKIQNEDGDERSSPEASFLGLFAAILALNFLFAMLLSGKDLFTFYLSDVTFSNFRSAALERGVESGSWNSISRVFINIYVIFESFKIAAANEFLLAFDFNKTTNSSAYYLFYLLVLVFNILKLLAFTVPLVFMQRGLVSRGAAVWEGPVMRLYGVISPSMIAAVRTVGSGVKNMARYRKDAKKADDGSERSET